MGFLKSFLIFLTSAFFLSAGAESTETIILNGESVLVVDQMIRSSLTGYDYRKFRNIVNTKKNMLSIQEVECVLESQPAPDLGNYNCFASYARLRDIEKAKSRIKIRQFAIRLSISDSEDIMKLSDSYYVDCQYSLAGDRKAMTVYFRPEKNASFETVNCTQPQDMDRPNTYLKSIEDQATLTCEIDGGEIAVFVSRKGQMASLNSRMCEPTYYQWFKDTRDSLIGFAGDYGRAFLKKIGAIVP